MKLEILKNQISDNCFIKQEFNKGGIVLMDSLRVNLENYIQSFEIEKKAPAFLITRNGEIYKFYDEKYYTDILTNDLINKRTIYIALENAGQLEKVKNSFINWCYENVDKNEVFVDDSTKNTKFFQNYTKIQIQALVNIIIHLSDKHEIYFNKYSLKNMDNNLLCLGQVDVFSESLNKSFNWNYFNELYFI